MSHIVELLRDYVDIALACARTELEAYRCTLRTPAHIYSTCISRLSERTLCALATVRKFTSLQKFVLTTQLISTCGTFLITLYALRQTRACNLFVMELRWGYLQIL